MLIQPLVTMLILATLGAGAGFMQEQPHPTIDLDAVALSVADLGPEYTRDDPQSGRRDEPTLHAVYGVFFRPPSALFSSGPFLVEDAVLTRPESISGQDASELLSFVQTVAPSQVGANWAVSADKGPSIGDATEWAKFTSPPDDDGLVFGGYTVAFSVGGNAGYVLTAGLEESISRADTERLARIVASRLASAAALPSSTPPTSTGYGQ